MNVGTRSAVLAAALSFLAGLCAAARPAAELDGSKDVYLTLAHATKNVCGWGTAHDNASVTGKPLQIGTALFRRGIGTHAPAELVFRPEGKYRWLAFYAGISADMTAAGSARVEVWADGKKTHQTPVLRVRGEPVRVCLDIAGARELRLVGSDAGNGNGADHINLGHLRLCVGDQPPKPDPPAKATLPAGPTRTRKARPAMSIRRTRPIRPHELPARGAATTRPASDWTEAFLTGNGRMGLMMFGRLGEETLVLNHCRLFLPRGSREIVPNLAPFKDEIRTIGLKSGPGAVHKFMVAKAREQGSGKLIHTDPFHPAFLLALRDAAPSADPRDYLMTEDFETGQVAVRWEDDRGTWQRRAFLSRPDNVAVVEISGPKGKVSVDLAMEISHPLVRPEIAAKGDYLSAHTVYVKGKGGYDSVIRVAATGGTMEAARGALCVTGADRVLLLIRIQPWKTPLPPEQSQAWDYSPKNPAFGPGHKTNYIEDLRAALAKLPADYDALLKPHARRHGELFHRVRLDLGGGKDRTVCTQYLLDNAAKSGKVPPALMERMYDACRYLMICSTGEVVPNLQGIWTGTWRPAWSGDWTLDSNIQLEVQSMLSANLPELMAPYFDLVESWLPDCRLNARKLYGCRGIVTNARASNTCLLLHWGNWVGEMYISGAGWLAHYFREYYRYTGDREFLRHRLVGLLKEIALFYEDLLADTEGEDGKYHFHISYSPELGLPYPNATFDIAVAREVLGNLIAACEELGIEQASVPKWKAMRAKMPPYLIGEDGALKEWSCPEGKNGRNWNHRHYSLMYPVYLSRDITPDRTPKLWKAANVALDLKGRHWFRASNANSNHITHGMMNHGQSAARLGRGEEVYEVLSRMITRRYLFDSFMISYWPDRKGFGFDAVGTIPDVVNQSLASGWQGRLDLLGALPSAWPKGAIEGILARGHLRIDRLAWDVKAGRVELEVTSGKAQTITLRLPAAMPIASAKVVDGEGKLGEGEDKTHTRTLALPAEKKVRVEITFSR